MQIFVSGHGRPISRSPCNGPSDLTQAKPVVTRGREALFKLISRSRVCTWSTATAVFYMKPVVGYYHGRVYLAESA